MTTLTVRVVDDSKRRLIVKIVCHVQVSKLNETHVGSLWFNGSFLAHVEIYHLSSL